MVPVTFYVLGGRSYDTRVPKDKALRDLQQHLCSIFGAYFPAMQANLQVQGNVYDDFADRPFTHSSVFCTCGAPTQDPRAACACATRLSVLVVFERNISDPYFFDLVDRRGLKCTLGQKSTSETSAMSVTPSSVPPFVGAEGS